MLWGLIKTLFAILIALVASIAIGVAVGYAAIELLPCAWFGSSFEGACGYGVLWASLGMGLVSGAVMFGWLCYRVLAKGSAQSADGMGTRKKHGLIIAWCVGLAMTLSADMLLPMGLFGSVIDLGASVLAKALFISLSAVLLRRLGLHPALSLVALVPHIGVIAVAVMVIYTLMNKKQQMP